TVLLTAKSTVNNEILDSLSITISLPPATSIEVAPFATTIIVGEEQDLLVSVLPGLTSQAVTTSSGNLEVVEIINFHLTGIGEGTSTITITSVSNPAVSWTITINVVNLADRMNSFLENLSYTEHKIVEANNLGFLYLSGSAVIADYTANSIIDRHPLGFVYSTPDSDWYLITYDYQYGLMGYATYTATGTIVDAPTRASYLSYQEGGSYEINAHGTINMTSGVFLDDIRKIGNKVYLLLEFDLAHPNSFLAFYDTGANDYDVYNITLGHPEELNELDSYATHYQSNYAIGNLTDLLIAAMPASHVSLAVNEAVLIPNPDNYGYRLRMDASDIVSNVYTSSQVMIIYAVDLNAYAYNTALARLGYTPLYLQAHDDFYAWYIFYLDASETYGYAIRAEDDMILVRPIFKKASDDASIFGNAPVYADSFYLRAVAVTKGILIYHTGLIDLSERMLNEYALMLENEGWIPVYTVTGWEYQNAGFNQAIHLFTEDDYLQIFIRDVFSDVPLTDWPTAFVSEQYEALETILGTTIPGLPTNLDLYRFDLYLNAVSVLLLNNTDASAKAIYAQYIQILLNAGWDRVVTNDDFFVVDSSHSWRLSNYHYEQSADHLLISFEEFNEDVLTKDWPDLTSFIGITLPEFPLLGTTYGYYYYLPGVVTFTDIRVRNYESSSHRSDYVLYLAEYLQL
ncbi:MAG: hypothetical protein EZS28_038976, partial [Streblomastix strix]